MSLTLTKRRLQSTVFVTFILLTTSLVSLTKNPCYNKVPPFIVSKNCLGKQFTWKYLGTSSINGILKNVPCSKGTLIIV